MSNDIRLNQHFFDNLKTLKLRQALGDKGVLCIIRLWTYAAKHFTDGILHGMSPEDLEMVSGWDGEPGVYASYATRMRWVDKSDSGLLTIHDWKEHQGWVYHTKRRSEAAKVNAEVRWERHRKQQLNATRIKGAYKSHTSRNAPSPSPYPLPLDQRQDQERIVHRPKGNGRFTPPTVEEVTDYCQQKNYPVDPVRFVAHYAANGWRVGRNPMKNWKAAVVTWTRRDT